MKSQLQRGEECCKKFQPQKIRRKFSLYFGGGKKIPIFFKRKLKITRARIYEVPAASHKIEGFKHAFFLACLLSFLSGQSWLNHPPMDDQHFSSFTPKTSSQFNFWLELWGEPNQLIQS
jgi:hypothetical protein